jgi:hypothetical protein
MLIKDKLIEAAQKVFENAVTDGQQEQKAQGHYASGKLAESFETKLNVRYDGVSFQLLTEQYGAILDSGVPANRVPYTRGSGARSSKFIEELFDWSIRKKPSLSEFERKKFVFAVANKMKAEGSPTQNSFSFSQNGRRTNWIENGIQKPITERINESVFAPIIQDLI